jgi:hypothetical protein
MDEPIEHQLTRILQRREPDGPRPLAHRTHHAGVLAQPLIDKAQ